MGKLCHCWKSLGAGYYAWLRGGESARKTANQAPAPGTGAPAREIPCPGAGQPVPHAQARLSLFPGKGAPADEGRRHPLPAKEGYKATTNSRHNCPIAPNLLQRQFTFSRPNQAWVGDITYIPTGEGWLYLAIVKDLCTRKIVGYAFSQRIDTQLTLDAPEHGRPPGAPCPWTDLPQRPGRPVRRAASVSVWLPWASGRACPARATPTTTLWRKTFSAA